MNGSDFDRIRHIKEYCDDIARTIKRFGANQETFLSDIDYYKSVWDIAAKDIPKLLKFCNEVIEQA